jgi:hypothetical protein
MVDEVMKYPHYIEEMKRMNWFLTILVSKAMNLLSPLHQIAMSPKLYATYPNLLFPRDSNVMNIPISSTNLVLIHSTHAAQFH